MDTCRLCLSQSKRMINVMENKHLAAKINNCVSVEISPYDNLPKVICSSCMAKVNDWLEFKQICIRSENTLKLREVVMTPDIKIELEHENFEEFYLESDGNGEPEEEPEHDEEFYTETLYILNETDIKIEYLEYSYDCEICSDKFDNCFEYLDHQETHNGHSVFKCDSCSETFSNRSDLVEHDINHKSRCPLCTKLILKKGMKMHLKLHSDRHVCPHCSRRFRCEANLEEHKITIHTDRKHHVCGTCGKTFATKHNLNNHEKIHKEERAYACKLCKYAAKSSAALCIHMATHANEVHICDRCSKTFKSVRNLRDHLRRGHITEKRYACTYCEKKYIDKQKLKYHVRNHTGVRPYKCKLCDKNFVRGDNLKQHMNTHYDIYKSKCEECLEKFSSKKEYDNHHCILGII